MAIFPQTGLGGRGQFVVGCSPAGGSVFGEAKPMVGVGVHTSIGLLRKHAATLAADGGGHVAIVESLRDVVLCWIPAFAGMTVRRFGVN
ncbi:MAG: hypothetical protein KAR47_18410 [Planctomycetes bacterium]|nr:hypothetical protein [Planctomycetota bacterium]